MFLWNFKHDRTQNFQNESMRWRYSTLTLNSSTVWWIHWSALAPEDLRSIFMHFYSCGYISLWVYCAYLVDPCAPLSELVARPVHSVFCRGCVVVTYPMFSTQTHSGASRSGSCWKVCHRGKLQSNQCPGLDTQPDPLHTVYLTQTVTINQTCSRKTYLVHYNYKTLV